VLIEQLGTWRMQNFSQKGGAKIYLDTKLIKMLIILIYIYYIKKLLK